MRPGPAITAFALACGSPEPTPPAPTRCDDGPTWETFARGELTTWCAPCHAGALVGDERQGAPVDVNLETLEDARRWAARIRARTVVGDDMPPQGGPTEAERARLGLWLDCGLPGEEAPPDACEAATARAGDARVGSDEDAVALCADGPVHLQGSLAVDATELDLPCVCAIDGALTARSGDLRLPSLTRAGGLDLDGAVRWVALPRLTDIDGALFVNDAPALERLELDALALVRGPAHLGGLPVLGALTLDRLVEVDGPLTVHALGVTTLSLPRLAVVDSVSLSEMPSLSASPRLDSLGDAPGGLVIERVGAPALSDGLNSLVHASGDVVLSALPTPGLGALSPLRSVAGDLVLSDLPELVDLRGVRDLERVGGDLVVRGAPRVAPEVWAAWVDGITVGGTLVLEPDVAP